jgi:tripartite-type tricarboxylate transporter receptor subunit TctC
MNKTALLAALALWGLVLGQAPVATAQSSPQAFDEKAVASFYRGKTVRIVVGFSAGGGFDAYSRVIGRHLGKYIPGNPTVIVDNMPGGGSLIAANHVYNAAPRDGTLIGNLGGPLILEQLFGSPGVQFDLAKLRHLAVPLGETFVMAVPRRSGVARFEDLLGPHSKPLVFGGIPGSTVEHAPLLLKSVLGANVRVVSGYKGTSDVRMAIESGEVGGFFNSWPSLKITSLEKFTSGEWLILVQLTETPLPDLPFPNVPTILDIAKTDEQRQLLRFGTSILNLFGKMYVMPPGVHGERAAAVEAAFMKTFADRDFLAEADKGRLEIGPRSGEQVAKLVREFLAMPPEVKSKLQAILRPKR